MDERGRVPFALVGVVLLVTASSVGVTLATRDAPDTVNAADRAVERATAAARVALERATVRASTSAAAHPVVEPANTTYGRALRSESVFRDALRLRVYAAAARAFAETRVEHGHASARIELPGVNSTVDARRAIQSVELTPVSRNDLRVRVRNATLVVDTGARVVRRSVSPSVVVSTPVLSLHDRVSAFDEGVTAGVLDGPGLARETTARLYPYIEARALAQYGGLPIENVLSNRHTEVATNDGLLAVQRATLGHTATRADAAVGRAYAITGVGDLLAVGGRSLRGRATEILAAHGVNASAPWQGFDAPTTSLTPAAAADEALVAYVDGTNDESLDAALVDAYRFDARVVARVTDTERRVDADRPPAGWTRVNATTETSITVRERTPTPVSAPDGFRVVATLGKRVVRVRETRTTWTNGSATRTTTRAERVVRDVTMAAVARPRRLRGVPARPLAGDLPVSVRDEIRAAVFEAPEELARRTAAGEHVARAETVSVDPPAAVRARAAREVGSLRDRLANVSTTTHVTGRGLLTANPVNALVRELATRRPALVNAPSRYDSLAARAVTAVRAGYVDCALDRVRSRADDAASVRSHLRETVADLGGRIPTGVTVHATPDTVVESVSAHPRYLSLALDRNDSAALAARNVNVFTIPYGDAADAVVDGASGAVRLSTAAAVLDAAAGASDSSDLRAAVEKSALRVRAELASELAARTSISDGRARRLVALANERWPSPAARARAATNGSLVAAVTAESRRAGVVDASDRVALAAALRTAVRRVRESGDASVSEDAVADVQAAARTELTDALGAASTRAARRRLGKRLGALPAGVPVLPVPGFWYATANVWTVSVRGGYHRFAVAGGSTPPGFGGTYEYVRRAEKVRFDVDGDHAREVLGRNTRIEFSFDTAVVVAVPPGPRGTGDVNGDGDERSPGW